MKQSRSEINEERIPIFKKWSSWYVFILVTNLLVLLVFLLLTSNFNQP